MLTEDKIKSKIVSTQYHRFKDTTVTVACVTLENGFSVIGKSACIDPNDFNAKTGKEWALHDAVEQIWQLEGYLEKQEMFKNNK